jgi:hypothetical protein
MGRPKKFPEGARFGGEIEEVDPDNLEAKVDPDPEPTTDEVIREVNKQEDDELAKLKKEVEELRIKAAKKSNETLEELMKDPLYGTTSYLTFHKKVEPDPLHPERKIYTTVSLSAFPDAINKNDGSQLAPDIGVDSREEADKLRASETIMVQHRGKYVSVKQAIQALRQEYYDKRKKADFDFLNTPKTE